MPLSVVITGANRHDASQLQAVLDARIVVAAGGAPHLCADAGYVGERLLEAMIEAGYMPHVRPRGEEKRERRSGRKPRRWVVEACHSWLNKFQKLRIRHEKLTSSYLALLHLAFAIIALRKANPKIIYG